MTINPIEFGIKDTTSTAISASYLELQMYTYKVKWDVKEETLQKTDDANFPIVSLPFISINMPKAHAIYRE